MGDPEGKSRKEGGQSDGEPTRQIRPGRGREEGVENGRWRAAAASTMRVARRWKATDV